MQLLCSKICASQLVRLVATDSVQLGISSWQKSLVRPLELHHQTLPVSACISEAGERSGSSPPPRAENFLFQAYCVIFCCDFYREVFFFRLVIFFNKKVKISQLSKLLVPACFQPTWDYKVHQLRGGTPHSTWIGSYVVGEATDSFTVFSIFFTQLHWQLCLLILSQGKPELKGYSLKPLSTEEMRFIQKALEGWGCILWT